MPNWKPKIELLGEEIEEEIGKLQAQEWQPQRQWQPVEEAPIEETPVYRQPVKKPINKPEVPLPEVPLPEIPEETKPISVPFWQRGLQLFAAPFDWIQSNVIDPALSIGLSPFVPDLEREPGEDYFDWKRREWDAWKSPGFNVNVPWSEDDWRIDVRGIASFAPWLLIPGAGQVGSAMIRGAGALGKLAPVAKAIGQAVRYSPWGLVERGTGAVASKAIKKLGQASGQVSRAISERAFGKIEPQEVSPVIRKFTDFFKTDIAPVLKVKRAAIKQQRKVVRAKLTQLESERLAGKIGVDEYTKLANLARAGKVDVRVPFETITPFRLKFEPGEIRQAKELLLSKLDQHAGLNASKAFDDLLSEGVIPYPSVLKNFAKVFGDDFTGALKKITTQPPKMREKLLDLANLPRAVLASWDLSATMRQGLILGIRHPTKVPRAFLSQLKAFASEKLTLQMDDALRAMPDFDDFVRHQGYMAPIRDSGKMWMRAEPFFSKVAEKFPMVRRSERAYITYLNQMRMGTWQSSAPAWRALGATDKDLNDLGKFINAASGRGNLPKNIEKYSPLLSAFFFSPRLQLSRLQLPMMMASKNPYVRKEAWKAMASFMGGGVSLLTLLDLSGVAKMEFDPRSADFGKIKIGETRLDIWTGYQQYIRFMAQMLTSERKTSYGNMTKTQRDEVAWRFLQSKSSPAFGLLVDLLRGESYMGEELFTDTTGAIRQVKNRFFPLAIQDMWDALELYGVNGMATALPATLGVGVLTYTNDLRRAKETVAKAMGKNWDDLDPKTQRELEKTSPILQRALKEYDRQVMGTQWGDWRLAGNAIEDVFTENIELAVAQYRQTQDGYKFREKVADAFTARRGGYQARSADDRFEEIVDRIEKPQTLAEMAQLGPEQLAIRTYTEALYGDDMYDEFGDYRFDLAEIRRTQLKQELGEDLFEYVEQYRGLKFEDLPPEYQELARAKVVMRPYWQVRDEAERIFGKPKTDSAKLRLERFVSRTRERLRRSNREIAKAYEQFYKKA